MHEEREQLSESEKGLVKVILIVEDDPNNREFFTEAIAFLTSYLVLTARNATEALSRVKHVKPHLFICDYRLPDMNGLELYDLLHATPGLENIPGFILTSVISEEMAQMLKSRGLVYLEKPFDLDVFLGIIQQMLA
jgi:CheY-like chemotaxis protein